VTIDDKSAGFTIYRAAHNALAFACGFGAMGGRPAASEDV
jgi:hypothetical protein